MAELGNLITAMVTPFDEQLQVDYERAAGLARKLASEGSDLLVSGTTGESPTTTAQEKLELYRVVREAVGEGVAVMAGTGSNNTANSIELTGRASQTGVDAIMLVGPYYNKPSQEGFYQHFKAIAEATDLPVVVYNVPSRTGKNIEASTVLRLANDVPNIVGVKEASGDLGQVGRICAEKPEGFTVWSGDDAMTLPILSLGGAGIISVAGHVGAAQIGEMVRAFHDRDAARAWELHHRLTPLFEACFLPSGNPACVKRALEVCGFPVGGLRLPLVEATAQDTEKIRAVCIDLGLAS